MGRFGVPKRMRLVCALAAIAFGSLGERRVDGSQTLEHFMGATRDAQTEWTSTRNCRVTPDGEKVVQARVGEATSAIALKTQKYGLTKKEEVAAIKGVTKAYLDVASVQEFGPFRKDCVLTGLLLERASLPPLATSPDTGILEIDGLQTGADIFIDGDRKGVIRQAFVLSVGPHRWKTMKCEEIVQVAAKDDKKLFCRKK